MKHITHFRAWHDLLVGITGGYLATALQFMLMTQFDIVCTVPLALIAKKDNNLIFIREE